MTFKYFNVKSTCCFFWDCVLFFLGAVFSKSKLDLAVCFPARICMIGTQARQQLNYEPSVIELDENLQETPIFDGKNHGFL